MLNLWKELLDKGKFISPNPIQPKKGDTYKERICKFHTNSLLRKDLQKNLQVPHKLITKKGLANSKKLKMEICKSLKKTCNKYNISFFFYQIYL